MRLKWGESIGSQISINWLSWFYYFWLILFYFGATKRRSINSIRKYYMDIFLYCLVNPFAIKYETVADFNCWRYWRMPKDFNFFSLIARFDLSENWNKSGSLSIDYNLAGQIWWRKFSKTSGSCSQEKCSDFRLYICILKDAKKLAIFCLMLFSIRF